MTLRIALTADGRDSVVIGPFNHTQPDSVLFRLRWKAGDTPSIRITEAAV